MGVKLSDPGMLGVGWGGGMAGGRQGIQFYLRTPNKRLLASRWGL